MSRCVCFSLLSIKDGFALLAILLSLAMLIEAGESVPFSGALGIAMTLLIMQANSEATISILLS